MSRPGASFIKVSMHKSWKANVGMQKVNETSLFIMKRETIQKKTESKKNSTAPDMTYINRYYNKFVF